MKVIELSVLILGVLVFSQGCCLLFDGTTQDLVILSRPTGQTMNVDGKRFKTPLKIPLDLNRNYRVIFPNGIKLELINNQINSTYNWTKFWWLMGIFPGALFSLIDVSTGAARSFGQTEFLYKRGHVLDPYTKAVLYGPRWR